MAGNRRIDYQRVVVVEPGGRGCSVAVKLDVTGARSEVARLAKALALDPSVQVRP
jgi:hypothetical protein